MGIIKTQQEFIGNSKRSGIPKGLQRISFCDYLRNFYSVKQIEIEPSSFNGYQKILENHIYPYFNERNIQFLAISSDEINTYLSYKLNNGFSSSTVKKHREVMGQALRSAFEKGWITDDIMSSVTNIVPDNSEKSIKSIPPDLLDSVLSFAEGTDIYVPVMLSVRYGLDRAEILGLRWSDIDAETREINIRNVVIKGSSSAYDIHPAADVAVRTLPAFDGDLAILEDEYAKQIELRKNNSNYCRKFYDFVVVSRNGYLIGPDNLSKKLNDLMRENNMERVSFSDLRRAYAASLVSMGFNNRAICSWLGVKSISTIGCEQNMDFVDNQICMIKNALEFYRKEEVEKNESAELS